MAAGKITLEANDGKRLSLVAPEGMADNTVDTVVLKSDRDMHISTPTAYHIYNGYLTATINANKTELTTTTSANYTPSDYIFCYANNVLYDCILTSTSGTLLTNTTYFTAINAGALTLNATVPLSDGIDANGSKVSLKVLNETVTGVTLTAGKNYVYRTDSGYGVSQYAPQYGSYSGFGDYFDLNTNKWYSGVSVFSDDFSDGSTDGWFGDATASVINERLKLVYNTDLVKYTTPVLQPNKKYKVVYTVNSPSQNTQNNVGCVYIRDYYGSTWGSIIGSSINPLEDITYSREFTFITPSSLIGVDFKLLIEVARTDNASVGDVVYFDNIAVYPIREDGSPDITNATPITPRNYLDAIVYADTTGNVTYVEQLPKATYFDEVKANEYKGKNACTAWVNFDGTTTPPTIRDSYNVSSVVRTATGIYDIYFTTPMDNTNYVVSGARSADSSGGIIGIGILSTNKVQILSIYNSAYNNTPVNLVQIFGGKN